MTTAFDVPAQDLIDAVSVKLQKDKAIVPPKESHFLRTGLPKENPPINPDWWFVRSASILRKLYINNIVGIERLRSEYGGKQNKGVKPGKAKKGSGAIVRQMLKQLEEAGYVKTLKGKGRSLTPNGQKLLDNTAHEVKKAVAGDYPGLEKY